ncbi:hypothetical protein ACTNEU_10305 [Ellagibacter isourolithinifaciens]|uniref:hypothetical protein n=1 Tax=Ellagibacter isourolithinifaciens TaxID=2137581 RepID=UPI003F8945A1
MGAVVVAVGGSCAAVAGGVFGLGVVGVAASCEVGGVAEVPGGVGGDGFVAAPAGDGDVGVDEVLVGGSGLAVGSGVGHVWSSV